MLRLVFALVVAVLGSAGVAQAGFRSLYSFAGGTDGKWPSGGPTIGKHGSLYGVTSQGGGGCADGDIHCGTVYRLDRDGTETVLHRFAGSDGEHPIGEMVLDAHGNLFGVTRNGYCRTGCGTVFELAPNGTLTTLHQFTGKLDCELPSGGLTADGDGNLYGVTEIGAYSTHDGGFGCVYKITPGGTLTILHAFDDLFNGEYPTGRLAIDAGGNLYGVATQTNFHKGTVFKITPSGTYTVLHTFLTGSGDGDYPLGVALGSDGTIYGATLNGGAHNLGTVFKIAPNGIESVLHSFAGGSADGQAPGGGVVVDAADNVYGVTQQGGDGCQGHGCGIVYRIAPDGTETILHKFRTRGGKTPTGLLAFDVRGNLRGVTMEGGASHLGTVFNLVP